MRCILKYLCFITVSLLYTGCSPKDAETGETQSGFDSVLNNADIVYSRGSKIDALNLVREAHANNHKSLADQMKYFGYCHYIYWELHDYDRCLAISDSMLSLCNANKNQKNVNHWVIVAYNDKGDALLSTGRYLESYDCYYYAKKLAMECMDSCALSNYSYKLSMVLYKQRKYQEAAHYFEESLNETNSCKESFVLAYKKQEILDNLGLCYFHIGQLDSSIYYYNSALTYINDKLAVYSAERKTDIAMAKAVIYGNLGDAFKVKGNPDTAIKLFKASIETNLQKGFANEDAQLVQLKLAELLFKQKKVAEVEAILSSVAGELDSIPSKNAELSWNKLMWQLNDLKNDQGKAYQYFIKYSSINDSLNRENFQLLAADMQDRMKYQDKQHQLALFEKEVVQQRIFVSCTAIVLIFLMVTLIVFNRSKLTRKNLETMKSLNNQIIEQKEKLQTANTDLEHQDQEKSRILRMVAHDIMHPINAITSLSELLLLESEEFSEEQRGMLKLIKEASENSITYSRDLLEASMKLETRNFKKEWVNIDNLLVACIELLSFKASLKGQKFVYIDTDKNVSAIVNKEKIRRVINNLLVNAIKFSYENSTIEVSLEEIIREEINFGQIKVPREHNVRITVTDHGVGIPDKNKQKIFDMFTEARRSGTSGESSNGLGLSISLQIAKAHGGNIWFESTVGQGTTFYFEFPVQQQTPATV